MRLDAVAPTWILRGRSAASRLRSRRSPLRGLDPAVALPIDRQLSERRPHGFHVGKAAPFGACNASGDTIKTKAGPTEGHAAITGDPHSFPYSGLTSVRCLRCTCTRSTEIVTAKEG
jgi:hypothetical protein